MRPDVDQPQAGELDAVGRRAPALAAGGTSARGTRRRSSAGWCASTRTRSSSSSTRATTCDEVERYLAGFPEIDRGRVLLMPQGTDAEELATRGAWLEPYCRPAGLHFCPRKQIEWFGLVRGT